MNENSNIIAHRGVFDNESIIENTKEAFEEAIKRNIPFELDIQLTKDNQLVVFHDDTLNRLADKKINIQESTYDEIKNIPLLYSDSRIPLLKEVLELNHDQVTIDIEIKKTKRWKETIQLLMKELSPYLHYMIKSFDPRIVKYIKKHYSWAYTGLLIDHKEKTILEHLFSKSKLLLKYSNPDFVAISKKLLQNKKYMNKIQNYPKFIWTITKEDKIEKDSNYVYICNII